MVKASELKPAALIAAMEKGDFYSTTGVAIEELEFTNRKLKVVVKPEQGVEYNIQFWGAGKFRGSKDKTGVLLKQVKGTRASYKFRTKNLYVRAKVISNKLKDNPYTEGDLETAWTQPVRKN
jgi:hypothetical protein